MDTIDTNKTALNSDSTMVVPQADQNATLLGTTVTCPVCRTENSPGEKYCGECGFLLSSTPGEVVEAADVSEQPRLVDDRDQREHLLREGENTVGRENADILLSDPTVSRRHALIVLDSGKCWVEDLGSTNGTYVAGAQTRQSERVEAADSVELKFGSAVLSLRLPSNSETESAELGEPPTEADAPATEVVTPEIAEPADEVPAEMPQSPAAPELVIPEDVPPAPVAAALLVSEADPGREYPIVAGTNTIGRRAGNDIVLGDDPYVSGSHAELVADDQGFWLIDLGSTNGTVLGGSRIVPGSRMALGPGDEIVFGRTSLRFEVPEAAEESVEPSESDEFGA